MFQIDAKFMDGGYDPIFGVGCYPPLVLGIRFGRQHRRLFVAIVELFEEFAHPTIRIRQAKVFLNPGDGLDRAANLAIQPRCELLLLVGGEPARAAHIVEARERGFTASSKHLDPAFEDFGMDMQDLADGLGILAAVQEQDRV